MLLGRLKKLGFLGYGKEGRELQGDLRGVRDLGTTDALCHTQQGLGTEWAFGTCLSIPYPHSPCFFSSKYPMLFTAHILHHT